MQSGSSSSWRRCNWGAAAEVSVASDPACMYNRTTFFWCLALWPMRRLHLAFILEKKLLCLLLVFIGLVRRCLDCWTLAAAKFAVHILTFRLPDVMIDWRHKQPMYATLQYTHLSNFTYFSLIAFARLPLASFSVVYMQASLATTLMEARGNLAKAIIEK